MFFDFSVDDGVFADGVDNFVLSVAGVAARATGLAVAGRAAAALS